LLVDFPFADEASKAHAIAAMLHPFVRPMVSGPTPLHVIDKPTPGTGAGYLVQAISLPALGRQPTMTSVGRLEDEQAWKLAAVMAKGPVIVVFDNVTKLLDSGALAAIVTAPDTYTVRKVGSSSDLTVPVRNLWLVTGNNVQLTNDLTRRAVLIRLDANMEQPEERRGFLHEPFEPWIMENRGLLIWAALVLIQAWIAEGMPNGPRKGTFVSWSETMGGILDVVGIPGFLANTSKLRSQSDAELENWKDFVESWWTTHGRSVVSSSELIGLAESVLDGPHDRDEARQSAVTRWGMLLKSKSGRVFGGKKIIYVGTKQGAAQYRLEEVNPNEPKVNHEGERPGG
jgi:putative DNA primase/helicase